MQLVSWMNLYTVVQFEVSETICLRITEDMGMNDITNNLRLLYLNYRWKAPQFEWYEANKWQNIVQLSWPSDWSWPFLWMACVHAGRFGTGNGSTRNATSSLFYDVILTYWLRRAWAWNNINTELDILSQAWWSAAEYKHVFGDASCSPELTPGTIHRRLHLSNWMIHFELLTAVSAQ